MTNVVKVDEIREELSTSFCDIITKIKTCELTYEARIRDNEIHDKEKNLQEFLLFLKELSPKTFS